MHSNHPGTHLGGKIPFFTPCNDIASLDLSAFLTGPAAICDLQDPAGDQQISRAAMIRQRVGISESDSINIQNGRHRFCRGQRNAYQIYDMLQHSGPARAFAEGCKARNVETTHLAASAMTMGLEGISAGDRRATLHGGAG